MNAWPVLLRELRAEARGSVNYRLRLAAGTGTILVFALDALVLAPGAPALGQMVFHDITRALYLGIWLLAPLLTCESLSKEKREGTLGLLFLTPLTALGIVVGKSLVHTLRALSFLFAAAPVMMIPLLWGGVSGRAVLDVLGLELSALALALGAGLLASSGTREWKWALFQTALWTWLFSWLHQFLARSVFAGRSLAGTAGLLALCLGIFGLIVMIGTRRIASHWQDRPLSIRQLWWLRTFCSPRYWKALFRQSSRRKLDSNPIAWLQFYSTWDRVAKWFWCGLAIVFVTGLITSFFGNPRHLYGVELLFALGLAYASAGSFRKERQNGAWELILVSPLERGEILRGRLRALRSQFFPAALTLFLPWPWVASVFQASHVQTQAFLQSAFIWSSYWSLPIIGLYFALGSRSFFRSLFSTCLAGLLVPLLLVRMAPFVLSRAATFEDGCGLALVYQFVLAALLAGLLRQRLQAVAVQASRA